MPHLSLPITPQGCVVDLIVGVSSQRADALRRAGQIVPAFVTVRGLIDTGATSTCIDPDAVRSLGLTPTGTVPIHTPSTAGTAYLCPQYDVMLAVYHPKHSLVLGTMPIITTPLSATGVDALIGRDVLGNCLYVYDGAAGTFSLAF